MRSEESGLSHGLFEQRVPALPIRTSLYICKLDFQYGYIHTRETLGSNVENTKQKYQA